MRHRRAAPEPSKDALGGQRLPGRFIAAPAGAPIPSTRGPGSLPDGGRFLLSRLTARLNIAAGTPGRKEDPLGSAAAEPEEGEEEEAEEEEPAQHRPGACGPHPAALLPARRRVARSVRPTGPPRRGPCGPAPGCLGRQGAAG